MARYTTLLYMAVSRGNLKNAYSTPFAVFSPTQTNRPDIAVLWLQGWTSTIKRNQPILERLSTETNLTFAILDYAGQGLSHLDLDTVSKNHQFSEVIDLYDKLLGLGYKRIVVVGGSFGGYLACLLTRERPVIGLILRAPAVYPDKEFPLPYKDTIGYEDEGLYEKFKHIIQTNDTFISLEALRCYTGRTVVLLCEKDSIVPEDVVMRYVHAAASCELVIAKGMDHSPNFMPNPPKQHAYLESLYEAAIRLTTSEVLPQ